MCDRPDQEISRLVAEVLRNREDQHGDDILASIEPAPYHLDTASGETEHLKADICGIVP
jgi:hypothetical protein